MKDEEREFEVLSRRPIHRARKYACSEEHVRLHDGSEVVREVIRHPGAAVILPFLPDGRIMLVRVWRHAAGAWLLEVPAGTLEPGEAPAVCAARELEEETGHVASKIEPLGSWLPSPGILAETMHLYRATGLRATETCLDDDEHLEPVPMTSAEIVQSMGDGGITDGKTLLALFLGGIVSGGAEAAGENGMNDERTPEGTDPVVGDDATEAVIQPASATPHALTPELASEIRTAIVDARVAAEQRAAYVPLQDLANAMRANADALRSVQETQERIARAVDNSDRTEAVVQSTTALNETFRGVRAAQDALVGKLEREQKRPVKVALLAAGVVLLVVAVVATPLLMREDTLEKRLEDLSANIGTADRAAWEESRREAEADLLDRLEDLSKKSSLSEADRSQREAEIAEMRGRLETMRREKDALEVDRDDARRMGRENTALRSEVTRLRRDVATAQANDDARSKALADLEAEVERLRNRPAGPAFTGDGGVAAASSPRQPETSEPRNAGGGPVDEKTVPASTGPAAGNGDEATPRGLSATAVRDPGQVTKLLTALNGLLAGVKGRETWSVVTARALDGKTMVDVRLEARAADGKVLRAFEAQECRFLLDVQGKSLEIRMREGSVSFLGNRKVKFLEGRYSAFLAVEPTRFRNAAHPLVGLR